MTPQNEIETAYEHDQKIAAVIGIARLRDMTGASLRALRHYESVGLLSPLRTANGGRLFTPAQADMAAMIVLLRRLDVPVRKIRDILDPERSPDSRARAFKLALEAVSAKLTRRLDDLRDAIAEFEGAEFEGAEFEGADPDDEPRRSNLANAWRSSNLEGRR
jgi:DNA-binding transcriptional MerR regulator